MEYPDRPPLGAEVYEDIETRQFLAQKIYDARLKVFSEDLGQASPFAFRGHPGIRPPKRPIAIGKCLGAYAIGLFDIEASLYPRSDGLSTWLEKLARRVEEKIITHVLSFGNGPSMVAVLVRLTYHASEQQMREAIRAALKERVSGTLPAPSKPKRPITITTTAPMTAPLQAMKPEHNRNTSPPKKTRMSVTISSPTGARRMESFLSAKGIGQTEFATELGITDRTLRAFRSTGKIKRETFDKIAAQMGTTRENLMDPNG